MVLENEVQSVANDRRKHLPVYVRAHPQGGVGVDFDKPRFQRGIHHKVEAKQLKQPAPPDKLALRDPRHVLRNQMQSGRELCLQPSLLHQAFALQHSLQVLHAHDGLLTALGVVRVLLLNGCVRQVGRPVVFVLHLSHLAH